MNSIRMFTIGSISWYFDGMEEQLEKHLSLALLWVQHKDRFFSIARYTVISITGIIWAYFLVYLGIFLIQAPEFNRMYRAYTSEPNLLHPIVSQLQPQPLSISSSGSVRVESGYQQYALLENPNSGWEANVIIIWASGNSQNYVILPGEQRYIIEGKIYPEKATQGIRAEHIAWSRNPEHAHIRESVSSYMTLTIGAFEPGSNALPARVPFDAYNGTGIVLSNMHVITLALTGSNEVVGIYEVILPRTEAGEKMSLEARFPQALFKDSFVTHFKILAFPSL